MFHGFLHGNVSIILSTPREDKLPSFVDSFALNQPANLPVHVGLFDRWKYENSKDPIIPSIRPPFDLILQNSLLTPLSQMCDQVITRQTKLLWDQYKLFEHLNLLRKIYFMKDGFAFHHFCTQLFDQIDSGNENWFDENNLLLLFQEAFATTISFAHFLSLSSFTLSASIPFEAQEDRSIQNLRFVKIHFHIEWPLTFIITKFTLDDYNNLFSFFLQIKRAKIALDQTKLNTLSTRGIRLRSEQRIFLMRMKLLHFLVNLETYIVHRVLQTAWMEFTKNMKDAHSPEALRQCHLNYLRQIRDRCLLNEKAGLVLNTVKRILNMALRFRLLYNRLVDRGMHSVSYPYRSTTSTVQLECEQMELEFHQCMSILVTVLSKTVAQRRVPHLEDLLHRLNFNYFYGKSAAKEDFL